MRKATLIAVVIVMAIALPAAAGDWPCELGTEDPTPQGQRIRLADQLASIHSSQATYVMHGWVGEPSCVEASSDYCTFAEQHLRFDLRMNGVAVNPSYVTIIEFPVEGICTAETTGWVPPGWKIWIVFEFPTGFFNPGVYLLTGTWSRLAYPESCMSAERMACLNENFFDVYTFEDGVVADWTASVTLTLSVSAE